MRAKEQEEMQLDATSDREDRNMSSEAGLSDTSDPDHANDIEELIGHSFPVYFNFAIPKSSHTLTVFLTQLKPTLKILHFPEPWTQLQHKGQNHSEEETRGNEILL